MFLVPKEIYHKIIGSVIEKSEKDEMQKLNPEEDDQNQKSEINEDDTNKKDEDVDTVISNSPDAENENNDKMNRILKRLENLEDRFLSPTEHQHDTKKPHTVNVVKNERQQYSYNEPIKNKRFQSSAGKFQNQINQNKKINKSWICQYCNKMYSTKWSRNRHINSIHSQEKMRTIDDVRQSNDTSNDGMEYTQTSLKRKMDTVTLNESSPSKQFKSSSLKRKLSSIEEPNSSVRIEKKSKTHHRKRKHDDTSDFDDNTQPTIKRQRRPQSFRSWFSKSY